MHIFYILLFCSSVLSIQSIERTDFKNLGTHFERNTYADAEFEDFVLDEVLTHNLTRNDYKIFMKKGLKQYIKMINAIKENKRIYSGNYFIEDELNLTKTAGDGGNIVFDSVRGFSAIKIEDPHVNTFTEKKFEVRSVFHLPQLIFAGHLVDKSKSFQYKWSDVSYTTSEYKKMDDDFQIHSVHSSEDIHFNKVELVVADEKATNKGLESDIQQQLSSHLFDIVNFMRSSTAKYWLGTDNWYLRLKKDQLLDALSKLVIKTVETFTTVSCELPRFALGDEKTSLNYEMINGNLEIDAASVHQLSREANDLGDVEMTLPLDGWLKYYVAQQNCTSSCHFFGHKFQVTKANVRIAFDRTHMQSVQWFFEMKYAESLVDNRLKTHSDYLFSVVLEKVSKIVNEKFVVFLKSFLGPDFI